MEIGRCMRWVCVCVCDVQGRLVQLEWTAWLVLYVASASGQPRLLTSACQRGQHLDTAWSRCQQQSQFIEDIVEPSFFLPGIISLFIMCVEIIWNNSLVGRCARAEVWTPVTKHIMLYSTWRLSALTTGLHGQVKATCTHLTIFLCSLHNDYCKKNLPTLNRFVRTTVTTPHN